MRLKEVKMSTALKPADLGSISSVLKHLPAVLSSFQNDDFLAGNSAFQKCVGLSEDELACTSLPSLLILARKEEDPVAQGHSSGRNNQKVPGVLKNSLSNVHGQAFRSDDATLLATLNVTLRELV